MKFGLDDHGDVLCDVDTLIDTRMLIQANSGGGKSWTVRRVLEQTHGKMQQLVIDPEGEFASLREKLDYVHAAPVGGDTIAHPRSAALLVERLLELNVSAILDLYELKAHERVRFVRLFLEAMIEAPKKLWHPVLVVVDEAHAFCPQSGSAESAGAVIDLCSRGRKRGYSALLATQRIAKLHKDAAAELNNKLIGRTSLDIDLARASDELGFPKQRWSELRQMDPGQFFATGPAFSKRGVVPVKVGRVRTTHPKAGARIAFAGAPPTAKIRKLLPKLSDLPAEAVERAKTLEELRTENARLKRELSAGPVAKPAPPPKPVKPVVVEIPTVPKELQTKVFAVSKTVTALLTQSQDLHNSLCRFNNQRDDNLHRAGKTSPLKALVLAHEAADKKAALRPKALPKAASESSLPAGEKTVLTAIAQDDGVDREQVSVLTGYKRSTRDAYISRLTTAGLVEMRGAQIFATDAGLAALGSNFEKLPEGKELRTYWTAKLPEGERKLFELLIYAHPDSVSREALGESSGYKRSTRDAYLSRLTTRKLITTSRGGEVRASDRLF